MQVKPVRNAVGDLHGFDQIDLVQYADISGICGDIGGFAMDGGFLDGYIPCLDDGFFGIVKPDGFFHPQVSLEVTKDNSEIKCSGIAFSLSFIEPKIKLIPLKYGDRLFDAGENVRIRLGVQ